MYGAAKVKSNNLAHLKMYRGPLYRLLMSALAPRAMKKCQWHSRRLAGGRDMCDDNDAAIAPARGSACHALAISSAARRGIYQGVAKREIITKMAAGVMS